MKIKSEQMAKMCTAHDGVVRQSCWPPSDFVHVYFLRAAVPPAKDPTQTAEPDQGRVVTGEPAITLPEVVVTAKPYCRVLRQGWLYIRLPDGVWHEYEVTLGESGRKLLQRVIWSRLGADLRPATEPAQTFVMLPQSRVEVAFSEAQWSWERFQALATDAEARTTRMSPVDLSQIVGANEPYDAKRNVHELAHIHASLYDLTDADEAQIVAEATSKGIYAALAKVEDILGEGNQLAANYQGMWKLMVERMNLIAGHHWSKSAVLAMGVVALSKHNEDVADQLEHLSLAKLEDVLQTRERRALRGAIIHHKDKLIALLDGTRRLRLCAAILDYKALPIEPATPGGPCYIDSWVVAENLVAQIGDHAATLDAHLESNPAELVRDASNDAGRRLLSRIADPDEKHPLHALLFPAVANPGASRAPGDVDAKMDRSALSDHVAKRTAEALFKFISHYASLENVKCRQSVVNLLVRGGINLKTAEVTLGEFMDDAPKGDGSYKRASLDPDDYFIHSSIEENSALAAGKTGKKELHQHGGLVELVDDTAQTWETHLRVYGKSKSGKQQLYGAVSLEDFKAGRGFGGARWKTVRKGFSSTSGWRKVKVSVIVFTKPKEGMERWVYNQQTAQIFFGGAFAVLEGWNLAACFNAWRASDGGLNRQSLDFISAFLDTSGAMAELAASAFARAAVQAPRSSFTEFIRFAGGQTFKRGVGWLGVGGGILSAGLSAIDTKSNWDEGDDAAIGHAILVVGFGLGVWSGGVAVGFFSAGPPGWIAAVVLLVGAVIVYLLEDTPLEVWAVNSPFCTSRSELEVSTARFTADGKRPSWNDPTALTEALLDAVYRPRVTAVLKPRTVEIVPTYSTSEYGQSYPLLLEHGNVAQIELALPYFIDGVSLVYVKIYWYESPLFGSDVLKHETLSPSSIELQEGKYTLELDIPEVMRAKQRVFDQERQGRHLRVKLQAHVRVDVTGKGTLWCPPRTTSTLAGGEATLDDWIVVEATDMLR